MDVQANRVAEPVGTLDVALQHAERLLERDPRLAAEQADEILKAVPGHPHARLIQGAARRRAGLTRDALEVLAPLAREQTRSAAVQLEFALVCGESGLAADSVAALRRVLQLKPDSIDAWRLLGDQFDALGDAAAADHARAAHLKAATKDPRLREAALALVRNDLAGAEAALRNHLQENPTDIAALRMLGEVAVRLQRYPDALVLLERCLELAPGFDGARHNYAVVLNRQGRAGDALLQVQQLLSKEPRNPGYRNLQAAVLATLGDYGESIRVYEAVLREFPHQPKVWMSYGHSLKTARRQSDSILAYRKAIEMEPTLGEAYWSLANLKTFRFSAREQDAMREAIAGPRLPDDDRLHFEFSLGKALEDEGHYAASFEHYARGNALRKRLHPYDADDNTKFVRRSKATFSAEFFAARASAGAGAADPIFIVGLPRAGSTLIEQILASHSQVEGTMELPDIPRMAAELFHQEKADGALGFAQSVAALAPADLRALGERYIAQTRTQRRTDRPFFIDKMPNNYLYAGMIHLILPNAKIIDARRHPIGCCFSAFKQHFARGQNFSYSLEDLGRYYRDYVDLMAHMDQVLPGRVHRVYYEDMIDDTERQTRALLAHCGLDFEDRCLRFYENDRAVRTASSEQVRQPIFREGMDQWRKFEPWLQPLKRALGPIADGNPHRYSEGNSEEKPNGYVSGYA